MATPSSRSRRRRRRSNGPERFMDLHKDTGRTGKARPRFARSGPHAAACARLADARGRGASRRRVAVVSPGKVAPECRDALVGRRDGHRHTSRHRGGLADRAGEAHRRPDAHACAMSALAEELAQDALVAALEQWPEIRRPRQSRRLADGRPPSIGPSTASAATSCSKRKHEELGRELEAEQERPCPTSTRRSTTMSATICSA